MILGKNTTLRNILLAKKYLKEKQKWRNVDEICFKNEINLITNKSKEEKQNEIKRHS